MEIITESVQGTCHQMCSKAEILMRETEGLLHQLEALEDGVERKSKCLKADPSKVIKQFSRPAAGRAETNPSELRPAPVLRDTLVYLYERVVPRDHPAWSSIYEFVFDRLRAVRQDMVIQGITGCDAIGLLEQIIRFHLYSSYRLRDSDIAVFDPVINKQHLLECLKRLLCLYQVTPGYHKNRPEFECVYLLSNLGDTSALAHYLDLSPEVRKIQMICQCYDISISCVLRNYARALHFISRIPSAMLLCAACPHVETLRINYLQILSVGYSVINCSFPVPKLRQLLHLDTDEETYRLCSRCGLADMFDNKSTEYICFNKSAFIHPKESKAQSSLPVLDKLLKQASISAMLLGTVPGCQGVQVPDKAPRGVGRGRGRGRRE